MLPLHESKNTERPRAASMNSQICTNAWAGVARAHLAQTILAAWKRTKLSAGNAQKKRQITPDYFAS